jgi:pimeloyl-ACP methyl ester carboxylesterase
VVTSTGMDSELGRVAGLLRGAEPGRTPLQQRLDTLVKGLALAAGAVVVLVFVAPTQITYGRWDRLISTRFAPALTEGSKGAELVVFDHLSHAGLHEDAEGFNRGTLDFLTRQKL